MAQPAKRPRTEEGLPQAESLTYSAQRVLGKGSFGVVFQAKVIETDEIVAIKSTRAAPSDEKDHEIQVLKELRDHPNIIYLRGAFMSLEDGDNKMNLVLEFLSDTLHRVIKHTRLLGKLISPPFQKLYTYQMLRGLAFVHGKGFAHCDIKPQNLLLDGKTHTVKLCDFGTAKRLKLREPNLSYVCSRFYRAPELCFGSSVYTSSIDLWSAGCVFGEMLLAQPLFAGNNGITHIVEIIKVLGTPSPQELQAMNPGYPDYKFEPALPPLPWEKVFKNAEPQAHDLIKGLLRFDPASRTPALQSLLHPFFDYLRENPTPCPTLFNFRDDELWWAAPQFHDEYRRNSLSTVPV
mmetsp:Transcript_147357/g.260484  ORF Transcript_147357/g.260484 Transcript_147357/m.260484 type:complete len:349 (+) Transcript_147357:35-1081(+)